MDANASESKKTHGALVVADHWPEQAAPVLELWDDGGHYSIVARPPWEPSALPPLMVEGCQKAHDIYDRILTQMREAREEQCRTR